jgi:hypothetical protein
MSAADLLPWLNLLLVPCASLLVSINSRLAALQAVQASHAEQLQGLRTMPPAVAGMQAVLTEHGRRLDSATKAPR